MIGVPGVLFALSLGFTCIVAGRKACAEEQTKKRESKSEDAPAGNACLLVAMGGFLIMFAIGLALLIRCQYKRALLSNSSGRVINRRLGRTPTVQRASQQPIATYPSEAPTDMPFQTSPYTLSAPYPSLYPPLRIAPLPQAVAELPAPPGSSFATSTGGIPRNESATGSLGLVTPYQSSLADPGYITYYNSLGSTSGQTGPYPSTITAQGLVPPYPSTTLNQGLMPAYPLTTMNPGLVPPFPSPTERRRNPDKASSHYLHP
ncbi:uncharacterized protein LOC122267254 isoform X2 [Penaeus japonicus]|nr:uncharacterized protein LOC122267254 isoform X2 [Penaeus japonicus]